MRANQMRAACGIHFTVEILACQYGAAPSRSAKMTRKYAIFRKDILKKGRKYVIICCVWTISRKK